MKQCIITIKDEVYCNVSGLYPSDVEFLYKKFGIQVEGAFFMPAVKLGRWDGYVRYFEKTGKTFVKLLDKIVPYIINWDYDIQLIDKRPPLNVPKLRIKEDHFTGTRFKLRSYQVEAINGLLDSGCGFLICGTGGGKSLITAGLTDILGKEGHRVITIVPSGDLVQQSMDTFMACGIDAGAYSGESKDINKTHCVATWQSLQNNPVIMKNFSAVIIDESHGARASIIQTLINEYGSHIAFRYGVTGTFPKPESNRMTLICSIGPIVKEITSKWLIDNGYLSEIEIERIEVQDDADLPDYPSEKAFLEKQEDRLALISNIVKEEMSIYGNTLVLVNSLKFGRKLQKLIDGSVFMDGSTEKDIRWENYSKYADQNDVILIASTGIASTGISIDRIFSLILVDISKSYIKAIQSIGRGLRKAGDKNKVHVVDIYSRLKYSKKHARERNKYYTEHGYPVTKNRKESY